MLRNPGAGHIFQTLSPGLHPGIWASQTDLGLGRFGTGRSPGDSAALPNNERMYHARLMNRGIWRVLFKRNWAISTFAPLNAFLPSVCTPTPPHPHPQRAIWGGTCLWIRSSRILTTGTTYGHWFCLSTRALLKQKHLMHDLIRWDVIDSIFHRRCHAKLWTLSSGHSTAFLQTQGYQRTYLPPSPPHSHPRQCVLPDFPDLFICTKS